MTIRPATTADSLYLAKLHIKVFPGFFLSTLGENFLATYYSVVLRHPETICLFAEDENRVICGYVLGRANARGYLKRIVKSAPFTFCYEGLKLLLSKPRALFRLIKNLDKRRCDCDIYDAQEYAEVGLIGVCPEYKGRGIGRTLFDCFVTEIKKQGCSRVSLTTDAEENHATLAAYAAWGFEYLYPFVSYPNRKMYRLIKHI